MLDKICVFFSAENSDIGEGFKKENKEEVHLFWMKLHDSYNSKGPPSKSISEGNHRFWKCQCEAIQEAF